MFRTLRARCAPPLPMASVLTLLALCLAAPSAAAQSNAELQAELERERAARKALEARVAQLETLFGTMQPDPLELQLLGSHGLAATSYPDLLALVADGTLDPARLVRDSVGLEEAARRLPELDRPGGGAGGMTVIRP